MPNIKFPSSAARASRTLLGAGALCAALAGCTTTPYTPSNVELPFEQAADQAGDGLIVQAKSLSAFRFGGWLGHHAVVVDPMLDAGSGQQTATTERLQQRVTQRLQAGLGGAEILPFEAANVAKAEYLLTGTLRRSHEDQPQGALLLNLALTDLKSRLVVAQASSLVRNEGLDATPLRFYSDSPVVIRDRVIEGYAATTAAPVGQQADPVYLKNLAVAPAIGEATSEYNQAHYAKALEQFNDAHAPSSGEQMRVLAGIYLTLSKVGKTPEAEQAFAALAAFGVMHNQLRVKFLFNPGSTEFWSDPTVSGAYTMWLHQIARESDAAKACMTVIGHTSHTGSSALNDALSLQRAGVVRQRLAADIPAIGDRSTAEGRGFHENIIGSGTDDAVDALDRRVEFKIVPCP